MGTVNPRPRGGASLSGELRASRDDRQQIRRLLNAQPKPLNPVSVTGAIGTVRAEATISISLGSITTTSWEFGPATAYPTPGTAPTLVESTFGHFNVTESGWYAVKGHLGAGWSGSPTNVFYSLNPATTPAMGDTHQMGGFVFVPASGDVSIDVSTGVVYLYGDGDDPSLDNIGLLGFDLEWSGAAPSWVECWVDVTRVG